MSNQYQCHVDARGDITMADGIVIDRATGAAFEVGQADAQAGAIGSPAPFLGDGLPVPLAQGSTFLGGSGRNVILSGGPVALNGIYRPARPGFWVLGALVLEVTGTSAATLSDGVDDVAILSTGGNAPAGDFLATTYGEETYGSSATFTLSAAKETGWPGAPNDLEITISEGTAVGGIYTSTDGVNYESAADADWTLVLNSDGTVDFKYLSEIIATRAAGDEADPCGVCIATETGFRFNPEPPEAYDGPAVETNPFGTLELSFGWAGSPDLDIGVEFLGVTAGFGYSSGGGGPVGDYMTYSGDNTTEGGPETVSIDLAAAWDAGAIDTFADVMAMADWYSGQAGSGPATLTVTYDGGTPEAHTIHPSSTTPATTQALALRITAAGAVTVHGATWNATVRAIRRVPIAGVVYIRITETSGAASAGAGPFFGATLPAESGDYRYFPVMTSDGAGLIKQLHTGALVWA